MYRNVAFYVQNDDAPKKNAFQVELTLQNSRVAIVNISLCRVSILLQQLLYDLQYPQHRNCRHLFQIMSIHTLSDIKFHVLILFFCPLLCPEDNQGICMAKKIQNFAHKKES
jgi:hypothetical protein